MEIKKKSYFKNEAQDHPRLENWVQELAQSNGRTYGRLEFKTSLGKTVVWAHNAENEALPALVIFPGFRTTPLFWDLDRGLDHLGQNIRVYLVETNGQPNFSDGSTPDIKSLGYGQWAGEVLQALKIEKAFVAGASFGGLVCMKLALAHPEKVIAAFLLNPGCLQSFSLKWNNLYHNLLPIVSPSKRNIEKFLDKIIFCKPEHTLSPTGRHLLSEFELFAITRYKDNTQKPYDMGEELRTVKVATYLLEGDADPLFPFENSIKNARDRISSLQEVRVFKNVGHGIETYAPAITYVGLTIAGLARKSAPIPNPQ